MYLHGLITVKFWPLPSAVALRHVGLPLLPLHNFLLQKGRQRGLLWLTCRKCFPYSFCLPHTPPTASSWSNQTKLDGGIEKIKICSNYLASYLHLLCTHYHSPSSYRKSGVRNMGWIWPIIFIPKVPTEFYRVSNITKTLKVKQTGGLILKAKRPQLYKHVIADDVHRKFKTCMGRGQKTTH